METYAELVTYSVTAAELAAVKAKYAALSCDTPAGYEETRLAIGHCRDTRSAVEKRRVELKADALAYGRKVDSEAKRFTEMLLEIEEPLKAKKKAVDDEKDRIKAEAAAEKLRAIEAEITANRARQEAEARAIREAEDKRLAEERLALAAERKRLEAVQAEIDARQRAEAARIEEARAAERQRIDAEREKLAAEKRAEEDRARAERKAIETERRRVQVEKETVERAEFERLAKIKAEKEAAEKLERDRLEATRRAAEREAMLPDVEKLEIFARMIHGLTPPVVTSDEVAWLLNETKTALETIAASLDSAAARYRGTGSINEEETW